MVGAFQGRGRRSGRYGAFLLAVYDPPRDRFESFCKVGTGFDDAALEEMPRRLAKFETDNRPPEVDTALSPDRWMRPGLVLEVRGAELTVSPIHRAAFGAVRPATGLALRFPRYTGRGPRRQGTDRGDDVRRAPEDVPLPGPPGLRSGGGVSEGRRLRDDARGPVAAGSFPPKDIKGSGPLGGEREPTMLVEMTELLGRQIYTPDGRLLGEVDNVVVDVDAAKVDGLYVDETSPMLVEDSRPTNIPYRWVSAVNDVVLLKYLPRRVSVKKTSSRAAKEEAPAAPAR